MTIQNQARFTLQKLSLILAVCAVAIFSVPVFAQMNFSGEWPVVRSQDNTDNPYLGEYVGLPLSEEALSRAEIWDASIQSLPEWQCRPHSGAYIKRGPSQLRISTEIDPSSRQIVAFTAEWLRSVRTNIYMDGRPHPPEYAPHTWAGFSTGEWEGSRLKIKTTHLKEDYYRRNGVPQSDKATLTEYLIRRRFRGEDYMSWVMVAYDPVYLTEPLIRTTEYRLGLDQRMPPYPCTVITEVVRDADYIPHHLPGTNEMINDFARRYDIPLNVNINGAHTMYPEFLELMEGASE